ncbi:MAG TPA: glycosyltransferase, partial [Candidatus Saccharimonadales bacterium]|nr:glycosyltransferase [Candidatus Saccharimonadales bacterium]
CGRNARLRRSLQARYENAEEREGRIAIRGFVRDVDRLMDAASLVVSKAGGLTTAESLAKRRPMLILDPIPGQEERNCNYLVEAGAAIRLESVEEVGGRVREVLGPAGRLPLMEASASLISRPLAARTVAELVAGGVDANGR